MTSRSSRPLPRLWVIRCHTRAAAASRTGLEPTNSLQPGLQARRQAPELAISFTSPNTHPETATPGDPSQATVATAHTVTGTPSKRYKPESNTQPVGKAVSLALVRAGFQMPEDAPVT
jgi:hypothetical protein